MYRMQSKWLDASVHAAAYHMQRPLYDKIRPPSYCEFHHLNEEFLTRDRERLKFRHVDGKISSKRAVLRSIETVKAQDLRRRSRKPKNDDDSKRRSTCVLGVDDHLDPTPVLNSGRKHNRMTIRQFEQASTVFHQNTENEDGDSEMPTKNDEDNESTPRKPVPQFLSGPPRLDGNWGSLFDELV